MKCLIDMPMVRTEPAANAPSPQPAPPQPPPQRRRRRRRVLLVEDDAVLGFELQTALSDAGLDVIGPARTVEEALALAADKDLLAAVLDIHLGGVMVFPVAEYLRAERRCRSCSSPATTSTPWLQRRFATCR